MTTRTTWNPENLLCECFFPFLFKWFFTVSPVTSLTWNSNKQHHLHRHQVSSQDTHRNVSIHCHDKLISPLRPSNRFIIPFSYTQTLESEAKTFLFFILNARQNNFHTRESENDEFCDGKNVCAKCSLMSTRIYSQAVQFKPLANLFQLLYVLSFERIMAVSRLLNGWQMIKLFRRSYTFCVDDTRYPARGSWFLCLMLMTSEMWIGWQLQINFRRIARWRMVRERGG